MSQNDDSDEEIRLRDQFAIAAMQALVTKEGAWGNYIDGKNELDITAPRPRTERICTVAYIIADEMRKARLKSFT